MRSYFAIILVAKIKHIRKMYKLNLLEQKTAQYFLFMIMINIDEATDLSGSSGACFHDFVLKSLSEKVVCENIGCKVQTH